MGSGSLCPKLRKSGGGISLLACPSVRPTVRYPLGMYHNSLSIYVKVLKNHI